MNVIEILNKLGWDILSFKDGIYKVQMTHERWKREKQQIEAGEMTYVEGYNPLIDTFNVYVDEVCFNEFGNLFVSFSELESNAVFDCFEYRNMSFNELY